MTQRIQIPVEQFQTQIFHLFANALLLTSGEFKEKKFNTMTISWGSMGRIWERPFVQVVVRPHRYTYQFTEQYDSFTLSAFPEKYYDTLMMLGTKSGRDSDKIKESGLTPIPSHHIGSPGFEEAELIIECKKIYYQDINPKMFLANYIAPMYNNDYHRSYFGEILGIWGVEKYLVK